VPELRSQQPEVIKESSKNPKNIIRAAGYISSKSYNFKLIKVSNKRLILVTLKQADNP
jgi:hypothetical protein